MEADEEEDYGPPLAVAAAEPDDGMLEWKRMQAGALLDIPGIPEEAPSIDIGPGLLFKVGDPLSREEGAQPDPLPWWDPRLIEDFK